MTEIDGPTSLALQTTRARFDIAHLVRSGVYPHASRILFELRVSVTVSACATTGLFG